VTGSHGVPGGFCFIDLDDDLDRAGPKRLLLDWRRLLLVMLPDVT
jgi:hypothetical protein